MNMNLKIYTKQEEHLRWPHGIDPSPGAKNWTKDMKNGLRRIVADRCTVSAGRDAGLQWLAVGADGANALPCNKDFALP